MRNMTLLFFFYYLFLSVSFLVSSHLVIIYTKQNSELRPITRKEKKKQQPWVLRGATLHENFVRFPSTKLSIVSRFHAGKQRQHSRSEKRRERKKSFLIGLWRWRQRRRRHAATRALLNVSFGVDGVWS